MLVVCMANRHAADVLDFIDRRYGWLSATRIGQDVSEKEREKRLDAYRAGAVDVMVQVDMIGEGTDIKTISVIAKLDLVSARSKCLQQIFRGMRYFAPWEDAANVCDVFTSGDLGLSDTLDWMTREIQEGIRTRTKSNEAPPPQKADASERSRWAVTSVSENQFETHRLEMEQRSGNLRVHRQEFERPAPSGLDVKAQEEKLRKECAQLASELAYILQVRGKHVSIRDVHAHAKRRFGKGQSGMSLRLLKQKKQWLERCQRMKKLF